MGLDITVYRKVTYVGPAPEEEGDDWKQRAVLFVNPDFKERGDGLADGLYELSGDYDKAVAHQWDGGPPDPDRLKFRAGSYSGYGQWRAKLAELAGYKAENRGEWRVPDAGPFVELVNFSDCEGLIGPKTSAKLAKDFADWQERAEALGASLGDDGAWFIGSYNEWRRAFEMAAGEGVVDFH